MNAKALRFALHISAACLLNTCYYLQDIDPTPAALTMLLGLMSLAYTGGSRLSSFLLIKGQQGEPDALPGFVTDIANIDDEALSHYLGEIDMLSAEITKNNTWGRQFAYYMLPLPFILTSLSRFWSGNAPGAIQFIYEALLTCSPYFNDDNVLIFIIKLTLHSQHMQSLRGTFEEADGVFIREDSIHVKTDDLRLCSATFIIKQKGIEGHIFGFNIDEAETGEHCVFLCHLGEKIHQHRDTQYVTLEAKLDELDEIRDLAPTTSGLSR